MIPLQARPARAAPLLLVLIAACGAGHEPSSQPPPPPPVSAPAAPPVPTPCEVAAEQRTRMPQLLGEGRLDRAVRVLDRADALCPASAPESWAPRVTALAMLGRREEAARLADTIDAGADAPAAARDAAGAARATMAALDQPDAEALFQAGHAAWAAGRWSTARRLFDRAMVEAQRVTGQRVVLEAPPGRANQLGFAWSKDGRVLAVTAGHGVSIHDGRVGFRETRRLEGPQGEVTSVAFSPDGKTLAAGAEDNLVRLWDVATWTERHRLAHRRDFPEETSFVDGVVFSPDGKILVSVSGDGGFQGSIRLWDAATGTELRRLEGTRAGGSPVEFSADGKALVAGSFQEGVRHWDVSTGSRIHPPTGTAAYPVTDDSPAERTARKVAQRWRPAAGKVATSALTADRKTAAVAFEAGDTAIHVLNVATAAEKRALPVGEAPGALAFSPDGSALVATLRRRTWVWNLTTGAAGTAIEGDPSRLDFAPDSKTLAVQERNAVTLVDVATGQRTRPFRPPSDEGHHSVFALSPDGKMLAMGSSDHGVRLFTLGPRPAARKLGEHPSTVSAVAFSLDGKTLASCTEAGVRLWSTATGQPTRVLDAPGAVALAFSPDGKTLASGGDVAVRFWDVTTGRETGKLEVPKGSSIRSIAFSPDGKTLAISTGHGTQIRDVDRGVERASVEGACPAFSPDGRTLATGGDGAVHLWDVETGSEVRQFDGHSDAVRSLAFSPDGDWLSSGSDDQSVRLWNLATGKEARKLEGQASVRGVAFSRDGKTLVSSDDALRFWSTGGAPLLVLRALADRDAAYALTPGAAPLVDLIGPAHDALVAGFVCRAGALSFPFELCREHFEEPGLLGRVLAGDTSYSDP